jgi:hypothetical protein
MLLLMNDRQILSGATSCTTIPWWFLHLQDLVYFSFHSVKLSLYLFDVFNHESLVELRQLQLGSLSLLSIINFEFHRWIRLLLLLELCLFFFLLMVILLLSYIKFHRRKIFVHISVNQWFETTIRWRSLKILQLLNNIDWLMIFIESLE